MLLYDHYHIDCQKRQKARYLPHRLYNTYVLSFQSCGMDRKIA